MNQVLAPPLRHFYPTNSLPCPYLPGRVERKVITDLGVRDAMGLYNSLSRAGFRRSHHLAYRPACRLCNACVPVRVDVQGFKPTRSTRRLEQLNIDLSEAWAEAHGSVEQFALFQRYQRRRHSESDMAVMTFADYRAMIEDSPIETGLASFRDAEGGLVGACLVDVLDDGLSAVYSFYDPEASRRSIGTYIVLRLIQRAHSLGLPYVYLGYWIAESRKMGYKTRFRPLEGLGPNGWTPLDFG